MDQAFWAAQWQAFMNAPYLYVLGAAAFFVVGWFAKGHVTKGAIDALQKHLDWKTDVAETVIGERDKLKAELEAVHRASRANDQKQVQAHSASASERLLVMSKLLDQLAAPGTGREAFRQWLSSPSTPKKYQT